MATSRRGGDRRAAAARDDRAAVLLDGFEAVESLARLVRAIDRRNLWCEIAWDPEQAAADAARDVARVRRALDVAGRLACEAEEKARNV